MKYHSLESSSRMISSIESSPMGRFAAFTRAIDASSITESDISTVSFNSSEQIPHEAKPPMLHKLQTPLPLCQNQVCHVASLSRFGVAACGLSARVLAVCHRRGHPLCLAVLERRE